jgi:Flp pilus assembly protein TadD
MGAALVQMRKYGQAVDVLREALRLAPDHMEAHNNLGSALDNLGRTRQALPHFARVVELAPDLPVAHYNYAAVLAKAERTHDALRQLRTTLRLCPGDRLAGKARRLLAQIRQRQSAMSTEQDNERTGVDH